MHLNCMLRAYCGVSVMDSTRKNRLTNCHLAGLLSARETERDRKRERELERLLSDESLIAPSLTLVHFHAIGITVGGGQNGNGVQQIHTAIITPVMEV